MWPHRCDKAEDGCIGREEVEPVIALWAHVVQEKDKTLPQTVRIARGSVVAKAKACAVL